MSALEQRCKRTLAGLSQAANLLALMLLFAVLLTVTQAASARTFRLLYQFRQSSFAPTCWVVLQRSQG